MLQFLKSMELFLEGMLMVLPGVADRAEFTLDYSLALAAVSQLNV